MDRPGFSARLRYRFDATMSRGSAALIGWLALLSAGIIALAAAVLVAVGIAPEGSERLGFAEAAWLSLMRTLDAGTMGGDAGWGFRLAMLAVTLAGIFVISSLIGILTTGLQTRLEQLRKGRSRVVERDHTVVLGWSEEVFTIARELSIANANHGGGCIVVMGEADKVLMEEAVREKASGLGRTRVVCRQGNPCEMADLDIVSLETARSVILLSPHGDDPDAKVIKTLLAIVNNPRRRPEPYHIVAELREPTNVEVARLVGKDEVELVVVSELVARVIAQTCRQSGLSVVYTELLDFEGAEIYFQEEPGLVGRTFADSLLAYEDSAVIGICARGATPRLNPPMDTVIEAGDQVIAISEDDDTVVLSGLPSVPVDEPAIHVGPPRQPAPEATLLLGWSWRAPLVVRELDAYVAPGSRVLVVAEEPDLERQVRDGFGELRNLSVATRVASTTDRRVLDELGIARFNHIIVLSCLDGGDVQRADARTLVTLLHLRDIEMSSGRRFNIVSEMLDLRNRNLAEVTKADDFIVSDSLVSLLVTQIAENKLLKPVFDDLFDPEGSEVYLKPASDYVTTGVPVTFYTVVAAASRRAEVAVGYRVHALADLPERAHGVVVNPAKSKLVTFAPRDSIIVLAES